MSKSKRSKPKQDSTGFRSTANAVLLGSALNIIIYTVLLAICSLISLKADADAEYYKFFIWVICAISGFFGGYGAVGRLRKNGLIIGAVSALPAYFIIILVSTIISRTGLSASGIIAALIMTVLSSVGGIFSANRRR